MPIRKDLLPKTTTYYALSNKQQEMYIDLDPISKRWPLIKDQDGTLRFKGRDSIIWWMDQRHCRPSLDAFWTAAIRERWSVEDMRQFYREMGYTLCGFLEIFSDERVAQLGRKRGMSLPIGISDADS